MLENFGKWYLKIRKQKRFCRIKFSDYRQSEISMGLPVRSAVTLACAALSFEG
jgi:hypothetical protein